MPLGIYPDNSIPYHKDTCTLVPIGKKAWEESHTGWHVGVALEATGPFPCSASSLWVLAHPETWRKSIWKDKQADKIPHSRLKKEVTHREKGETRVLHDATGGVPTLPHREGSMPSFIVPGRAVLHRTVPEFLQSRLC